MNHAFLLKHYGHLTLHEMDNMTSEDRQWWITRLKEELDKQRPIEPRDGGRDHTPGQPPA